MGILSNLKQKMSRKKLEPLPALPPLPSKPETSFEPTNMDNVKAKMELVLTQMDSLRIQYETLNERMKNIERLVTEIRSYCK
jgi:hypothetical protein